MSSTKQTALSTKKRNGLCVQLTAYSLVLSAYCLVLVSGCAVLTEPLTRPTARHGTTAAPLLEDGYTDYAGVMHIHTTYSDGGGTFEDIARVANAQHLDYLITTDHNTLKPLRDGKQGWYGATLILVGTEISTRAGHFVALNVHEEINRNKLNAQQIIDEVNRQGGLGFIAHPYYKRRRWSDWTVHGFTGIEIYNVAHDTLDENRLRLVLWTIAVPTAPFYWSIIDRPYDSLRTWDELIAQRAPVVGVGASDAHELRLFGIKFAPYEVMFRIARTHLLIPAGTLTEQTVYDAIRQGHAYASIELLNPASGFSFLVEQAGRVMGIMGDTVPLGPGLHLQASLPQPATITLFQDGRSVMTTLAKTLDMPIPAPGVYRLEAAQRGKPWIFSNPIYVQASDKVAE